MKSLNAPILYNTIWRLLLDFIIGLGSYNEKVKYLKGKYFFAPISKFLTLPSSSFRYWCLPSPSWHPSLCLPFSLILACNNKQDSLRKLIAACISLLDFSKVSKVPIRPYPLPNQNKSSKSIS